MNNFTWHNPTRIHFGKGQIPALAKELQASKKILVTYGGGSIKANGVYDQVVEALDGLDWIEFGGVEPNPQYDTLMRAVELGRAEQVDFILAVGGGSVLDGSKFIAAAIPFQGNTWDILAKRAPVSAAVPLGSVLTLAATGSESNAGAVISRGEDKLDFQSRLVYPVFSVLDPETTYSLPKRQVANGVVDAYVHVMEQYLTYPSNSMVQDQFAEGILRTLIEIGPGVVDSTDYDLRANYMWAANAALNGYIGLGVPQDWATHMIGHELTAEYGVDHAQSLAIVLPGTLTILKRQKHEKLVQYGKRVWGLSGDEEDIVDAAIAKTRAFFEAVSVKTRLTDYGIDPDEAYLKVSGRLVRHGLLKLGERGTVTPEVAQEILALSA